MTKSRFTLALLFIGLTGTTAFAQSAPGGGQLLQPGETPDATQQPVQLHLPVHRTAPTADETQASAAPGATASQDNASAGESTPALHMPRHRRAPVAQVANTAPQSSAPVTIPFSFENAPQAVAVPAVPATQHPPARSSGPVAASPHATPSAMASTGSEHVNLTKRGVIQFEKNAPAPSPAQYRGLKILATDLNSQLESGASRIQLDAYGGAPGDKSSDARRLSLQRALSVRQLLIDDGIPSSRIDVRALGGSDDKGPTDRVDVFVRTG